MKVSDIPGIGGIEDIRIFCGDIIDRKLSQDPWILDIDISNCDWEYDNEAKLLRIWV